MLEQPASRAYRAGLPSARRSQAISPRGVCRASTYPMAPSTLGHIRAAKAASRVTRSSCQTPTATYATWLLSAAGSVTTPPAAVFFGHDPSARWLARSHS
jgi:hypothetical protein